MGNPLSFGAEGTHEGEILQSASTKDEAKAAGGYINCIYSLLRIKITNLRLFLNKSKRNKPDFNFILPKIRRYITTQNTLH